VEVPSRRTLILVVLALSLFRLAHIHLLWADEDYHLAAALQILHGRVPYRDFWYDKPPLTACYYLLAGAWYGWPLRLLDAAYIAGCCAVAYRIAASWWSRQEGWIAAVLLAFYTTFYLPSAVIPFAADAVMLLPHLLAIDAAVRRRPLQAGIWAGVAFLANTKAVFVLASCSLLLLPQLAPLLAGFGGVAALGVAGLVSLGAWPSYVEQVWRWGLAYTRQPPVTHPLGNGLGRSANWAGFHSLAVAGAVVALVHNPVRRAPHDKRWKLGGWLLFSAIAVSLGSRYAPHYFLQLLPPMVIGASHGLVVAFARRRRLTIAIAVVLLAIPLCRFGPRYATLIFGPHPPRWADVAMDLDSQAAARLLREGVHPGNTLLVWGYRPDLYVYSRLLPADRFWDSQPLTGVPADRHLSENTSIYAGPAARNRQELVRSHPDWIVDGLGPFNPSLAITAFPDLQPWLAQYEPVARTRLSILYRRRR
jgi:hypothetical protein